MTNASKGFAFLGALLLGLLVLFVSVFAGGRSYRSESVVLVRPCTNACFSRSFESRVTQTIPGVLRLHVTPALSGLPSPGAPVMTNGVLINIFVESPTAEGAQRAAEDAARRLCGLVSEDYALQGEIVAGAYPPRRFSFFHDRLQPGVIRLFTR